jgi:uncharacterized GH25 family protein
VGAALEIVPESDPTRLTRGDDFSVNVLEKGVPVTNFPLGVVHEGDGKGEIRKTDNQGRVRFRLTMGGRWLFRGTKLRRSTQPGVDWESEFTTLTVEVK